MQLIHANFGFLAKVGRLNYFSYLQDDWFQNLSIEETPIYD